ncbi:transposase [Aurantimonas sp. A2-1-M11]|uniref:IS91 family transposase n=1 Tax=Aurantimonas sp. A2-1-M11 TaxID=3113712 RepID=UPI002F932392
MIVPGGGLSPNGSRWVSSRPASSCRCGCSAPCSGACSSKGCSPSTGPASSPSTARSPTSPSPAFARHLTPVRRKRWVVYAKPPFAGPEAVLAYLSRYTHRVAISSRRIIAFDGSTVTFRIKDYRQGGAARHRTLTLAADEFIRRFLLHVLPRGFHRIRHYGFLTGPDRKANLDRIRVLLGAPTMPRSAAEEKDIPEPPAYRPTCPCCGGTMSVVGIFLRWRQPRGPPPPPTSSRECSP